MKKNLLFISVLILFGFNTLKAQHVSYTTAPKLIVRGDDMGSSHAANIASIDTYKNGIETCIELMVVTPWFPEAVKMLQSNPDIEVGLHLTITSEWDGMKWRPLTHCSTLTDANGYFLPMMSANPNYPGLSIKENNWSLKEVEQEFRSQIELALRNVPRINHLTGHMGAMNFAPEVAEVVNRLAKEYDLIVIDRSNAKDKYGLEFVGYQGSNKTLADKEESFIKMLNSLKPGSNYLFLDHPSLDNEEMRAIGHIGYEWVAQDRQGVTDLFKSEKVKQVIKERGIRLVNHSDIAKSLPRATPSKSFTKAINNYWKAVDKAGQDVYSLMVLQHGKVLAEHWRGEATPDKPHVMNSVSKTFTATAIGFAVSEGKLRVTDKVISFFPEELPSPLSSGFDELEIRHLLTMSAGQEKDPELSVQSNNHQSWVKKYFSTPIVNKPGTQFRYSSAATYMLSAIIQKVTGEKLVDYLYPRLFRPLGITNAIWTESPQGINIGGWGLFIKTEDMAKMGQFILQKGMWEGKQLLPETWIEQATSSQIASLPAGVTNEQIIERGMSKKTSDWLQGYGYQMWRCRHNAVRADGARGQFIIIIPDKDAVIVITANEDNMQEEINLVWKYILPALKNSL